MAQLGSSGKAHIGVVTVAFGLVFIPLPVFSAAEKNIRIFGDQKRWYALKAQPSFLPRIPNPWREKRQNGSSNQHEALLQRHPSNDCAILSRNEEEFFLMFLNLLFRKRQGPGRRFRTLDPLWPAHSRASSAHHHPGYGTNYRKQPLAGLWENGKCATNATVFFKNFCFPESFDNPASAPAGVCHAVWPGILAETWASTTSNLFGPMLGLLATCAERCSMAIHESSPQQQFPLELLMLLHASSSKLRKIAEMGISFDESTQQQLQPCRHCSCCRKLGSQRDEWDC
ncbi:uncharacterized protein LOC142407544 [Mycteria americana]|uniref:uncharacterized protein LOC142407544 n=1 Tax=Mycteria americana TaxID=33587 RepID=UPI003F58EF4A